jgi:hypothetical protein
MVSSFDAYELSFPASPFSPICHGDGLGASPARAVWDAANRPLARVERGSWRRIQGPHRRPIPGGAKWEHYLGFEQRSASAKAIKLSMIHLGSEDVREDVVIRPGSRYAIVKVTNGAMTALKGVWSWTAQEVY